MTYFLFLKTFSNGPVFRVNCQFKHQKQKFKKYSHILNWSVCYLTCACCVCGFTFYFAWLPCDTRVRFAVVCVLYFDKEKSKIRKKSNKKKKVKILKKFKSFYTNHPHPKKIKSLDLWLSENKEKFVSKNSRLMI